MPLYEYECAKCGEKIEVIQSFSDPPLVEVPSLRRHADEAPLVSGVPVQGLGLLRDGLREVGRPETSRRVRREERD